MYKNHQVQLKGGIGPAMGIYDFTCATTGSVSTVEYTFGTRAAAMARCASSFTIPQSLSQPLLPPSLLLESLPLPLGLRLAQSWLAHERSWPHGSASAAWSTYLWSAGFLQMCHVHQIFPFKQRWSERS